MTRKICLVLLVSGIVAATVAEASACGRRHCRHCYGGDGSRAVSRDVYYADESRDYVASRDVEYVPVSYRLELVSASRSRSDDLYRSAERPLLDKLLIQEVVGEAFERVLKPRIREVVDERLSELGVRPGGAVAPPPAALQPTTATGDAARISQLEAQLKECRDCIRQLQRGSEPDERGAGGENGSREPDRQGRDF